MEGGFHKVLDLFGQFIITLAPEAGYLEGTRGAKIQKTPRHKCDACGISKATEQVSRRTPDEPAGYPFDHVSIGFTI
jgi:hypothetical protein